MIGLLLRSMAMVSQQDLTRIQESSFYGMKSKQYKITIYDNRLDYFHTNQGRPITEP